jgi:hypothetical protein
VAPQVWRHPDTFDDVLSLADVDRALTVTGLRRPAFRLVHDGEVIAPRRYTRRARQGSEDIDDLIDTGRVMDHVRRRRHRSSSRACSGGGSRPPTSAGTWSWPSATRSRPTPT